VIALSYSAPAVLVAEDEGTIAELRQRIRRSIAYRIAGLGEFHARATERQGLAAEVRAIRDRWRAGERAAATSLVTDAMLEAQAIVGPAAQARRRLDEYRRHGADEVCLTFPPGVAAELRMRTLEALAP